ncbi:DUF397 domain-containing protein [Saccharopolyspora flava]|uniref:DUF397 domain-containing protein n=1 Tax=Saccharopolyspora flava TaxID=95161 RepID=A0A1I6SU18_9PSEU|nr:DUF397 domain-containing protein [Saccharopolyspora flava]SFS80455.1 protein of unknown function [Saccharopolyspora flava]
MTSPHKPDNWRTSTRSQNGEACVEIGRLPHGQAAVRDTKDRQQGFFTATAAQWRDFVHAVKTDRFSA